MALADFVITLLTFVTVYSLFGLGLNVKYGVTGLVDFGHVVYFMVGAYVTVVLSMPASVTGYAGVGGFGLPALLGGVVPGGAFVGWLLAIVGGMVAAAVVSLLVGVPAIRLREDYLAITALGVATIITQVFENEEWLFNGPFGISSVYKPLDGVFPLGTGSFTLNMVVLGGLSVLVLGYAGYRAARIGRSADVVSAAAITATVLLVAGSLGAVASGSSLPGLVLLGVAVAAGYWTFRRTDAPGAVVTIGVVELFVVWYFVGPFLTGGGVVELQKNVMWLFDPTAGPTGGLDYDRFLLLLSTAMLAVAYWWVERTVNSPYGRVLRSVRDDEDVPKALGKPTNRYKVQALMFGSALAGAAGALWSVQLGFISPGQFASTLTFFAFTAVIIGGTANNRGVVLGTAVFWSINSGTRFLNDYVPSEFSVQLAAARLIVIGALLIVILYYRPEGILGEQDYEVRLPDEGGSRTEPIDSLRATVGGESDD